MSTLATMLHRAGMIGEEEAARAATRARQRGGSVVESLLDLGLADETQLVGFVQSKLMIPQVTPGILAVLEQPADHTIDPQTAWRHEVMPVSVDDVGNLTLAMSDPTDVAAVDAVVALTRAYVIRAVAPRSALLRALARFYGDRPARPPAIPPVRTEVAPAVGHNAVPPVRTEVAPAVQGGATPPPIRTGATAPPPGQPARRPVPVDDLPDSAPLSAAAFGRVLPRLVEATSRDEITTVLLGFLGEGFGRVVLFVHTQGTLRGRDCRGEDLMVDAVRQVRIPMAGPSTFADVIDSGRPHFGPWPDGTRINTMFAQAMGGIRGNVLVLPVKLGGRVPLIVFASNTPHPVDPRSLTELVDGVSSALERLILARKTRDNLPAVE